MSRCCEKTMEVMRSSQEALLTIVEVRRRTAHTRDLFKFDPSDGKSDLFHTSVYEIARRKPFVNSKVKL